MSPEPGAELVVPAVIAAAVRRARVLVLIEAAVWAVAAAAITPVAGALLAPAVALARWRTTSRASILRALERAHPDSRNLFVTVDELARDTLIAKPLVRARVFADAAAHAKAIDLRAVVPAAPLLGAAVFAALAWTTAGAVQLWRAQAARGDTSILSGAAPPNAAPAGARLQVSVTIQPPAYTGLEETKAVDPDQVQAVEGSTLVLSIDASARAVTVEQDGRTHALTRGAGGRFAERVPVTKTGYLAVIAGTARRLIPVIVSPDALPVVRLTAPGHDLVYAGGNPRIAFDARATDDYGLRSLVLRYTRVTGSGENFEFKEGEIPLAVKSASAREWTGSVSRSLAELDLHDGDMLVYRAVAADARPGDGTATSDAFFIEISKLGVAAGDAFTLPEEESKYALSQQMLIVKTERLHQKRGSLTADDLAEQSLNLAVEQRMIRAEFVFMLGGEINDEEVEAEQSVELQAGRLQNRGQRDLRTATIAMSQAEKLLTGVNTADALVAERAAVTALQRAFSRDRYILRAMATRSQLDSARRLTGSLAEAAGWRRVPPDPSVDRRTALLQDLLRGIVELTAIPPGPKGPGLQADTGPSVPGPEGAGLQPDSDARRAGPFGPAVSASFRQRAQVVAEEATRIDPSSASLRTVAAELQRAADAPEGSARSAALAAASTAAASEARRTQAGAPATSPSIAPALSGAFADATGRGR